MGPGACVCVDGQRSKCALAGLLAIVQHVPTNEIQVHTFGLILCTPTCTMCWVLACTMVVEPPGAHSLHQVYRVHFKRSLSSVGHCKMINGAGEEVRITAGIHVAAKIKAVKTEV
jgi:hypothetical protein